MDDKNVIQRSKTLMIAIMGISLVLSTSGAISGTIPLMDILLICLLLLWN